MSQVIDPYGKPVYLHVNERDFLYTTLKCVGKGSTLIGTDKNMKNT